MPSAATREPPRNRPAVEAEERTATLQRLLEVPDLAALLLRTCDAESLHSLRATCRAALIAVRQALTHARWDWHAHGPCPPHALAGLCSRYPNLQQVACRCAGPFHEAHYAVLASAPWLTLRVLYVPGCDLGPRGSAALAAACLPSLRELRAGGNNLRDAGVVALARARWPHLEVLAIEDNGVSMEGARVLAQQACSAFPALGELHMYQNALGDDGAVELAQGRWPATLARLDLGSNLLGARGAAALPRAVWMATLRELALADNPLGAEGVAGLAQGGEWPLLQALDLSRCGIIEPRGLDPTNPATAALLALGRLPSVGSLDLSGNSLGAMCVTALLDQSPGSGFRSLRTVEVAGGVQEIAHGLLDGFARAVPECRWEGLYSGSGKLVGLRAKQGHGPWVPPWFQPAAGDN